MDRKALRLLPICLPLFAHAQSFTQTFGGMNAQDGLGAWPSTNGFTVAVRQLGAEASGTYTASLARTNSSGGVEENLPLGPTAFAFMQNVVNAEDGSVFVLGSQLREAPMGHDGAIMHLESDGTPIWSHVDVQDGMQQYYAGACLPDGGIVACGVSSNDTGHDALIVRYNADGEVVWRHTEPGSDEAEALGLAVQGQDLMITGRRANFSGHDDVLAMRMSLDGAVVWSTTFGFSNDETGRAVVSDGNGAFTLAGWTDSFGAFDQSSQRRTEHIYLLSIDLNGDTLWTRTIGDTLYDQRAYDLERTIDGDLLICGERATSGLSDALLLRTSSNGDTEWLRVLDLGKEERLTHALPLGDGVLTTGWSFGPYGRQVLFIKRNELGN